MWIRDDCAHAIIRVMENNCVIKVSKTPNQGKTIRRRSCYNVNAYLTYIPPARTETNAQNLHRIAYYGIAPGLGNVDHAGDDLYYSPVFDVSDCVLARNGIPGYRPLVSSSSFIQSVAL